MTQPSGEQAPNTGQTPVPPGAAAEAWPTEGDLVDAEHAGEIEQIGGAPQQPGAGEDQESTSLADAQKQEQKDKARRTGDAQDLIEKAYSGDLAEEIPDQTNTQEPQTAQPQAEAETAALTEQERKAAAEAVVKSRMEELYDLQFPATINPDTRLEELKQYNKLHTDLVNGLRDAGYPDGVADSIMTASFNNVHRARNANAQPQPEDTPDQGEPDGQEAQAEPPKQEKTPEPEPTTETAEEPAQPEEAEQQKGLSDEELRERIIVAEIARQSGDAASAAEVIQETKQLLRDSGLSAFEATSRMNAARQDVMRPQAGPERASNPRLPELGKFLKDADGNPDVKTILDAMKAIEFENRGTRGDSFQALVTQLTETSSLSPDEAARIAKAAYDDYKEQRANVAEETKEAADRAAADLAIKAPEAKPEQPVSPHVLGESVEALLQEFDSRPKAGLFRRQPLTDTQIADATKLMNTLHTAAQAAGARNEATRTQYHQLLARVLGQLTPEQQRSFSVTNSEAYQAGAAFDPVLASRVRR